jgi:hypothetical protein
LKLIRIYRAACEVAELSGELSKDDGH